MVLDTQKNVTVDKKYPKLCERKAFICELHFFGNIVGEDLMMGWPEKVCRSRKK